MKRRRFSEDQVVGIQRDGQGRMTGKALCAKRNSNDLTYNKWKQKDEGLEGSDVRKLPAMTEEACQLKRIVAELVVQNDILTAANEW